jgi:hypothetical protein
MRRPSSKNEREPVSPTRTFRDPGISRQVREAKLFHIGSWGQKLLCATSTCCRMGVLAPAANPTLKRLNIRVIGFIVIPSRVCVVSAIQFRKTGKRRWLAC